MAQLHFAQRLIVALLAISTSGLSVIAFPQLAGHLAASGRDVFARHFALATRRLIFIVMPIAIGFGIYAEPVIADLLQRGRFDSEASVAVGGLIVCFMGMFVGASWGELLARGFYTLGDTRTPTIVGAIALTIVWQLSVHLIDLGRERYRAQHFALADAFGCDHVDHPGRSDRRAHPRRYCAEPGPGIAGVAGSLVLFARFRTLYRWVALGQPRR